MTAYTGHQKPPPSVFLQVNHIWLPAGMGDGGLLAFQGNPTSHFPTVTEFGSSLAIQTFLGHSSVRASDS